MNPPMIKVPLTPSRLPKDERDYFRTPSAPPPPNPLGTNSHLPPPSPLPWFQNHHHCGTPYGSSSNLAASSPLSTSWESYHHQYFKTAGSASSPSLGNHLSLYGLPCPPTSPLVPPIPAPAHTSSSSSSYLPLSLKSPITNSIPPVAHSHNDRPYMSSPGIFRPIPSRPSSTSSSNATPLVIPRVEFESGTPKNLKSEDKSSTGAPIKSEPEYLNDSDSAFEDGDGSFSFCSRTTPVNHKSIKKWRQRSTPSMKPISVNTSTPLRPTATTTPPEEASPGPLSAPGSLSSSWSSPFSSPQNGLHQRSSDSLLSPSYTESGSYKLSHTLNNSSSNTPSGAAFSKLLSKPNDNIPVGIAVARLRPCHDKVEDPCLKKEPPTKDHSFQLNVPKVQCPLPSKDSPLLPLGYQWAKDPITGQIYFLPSNPIWATTPGYGYLQWQQEAWLAHQHLQLSLSGLNIPSSPLLNENTVSSPLLSQTTSSSGDSQKHEKETLPPPPPPPSADIILNHHTNPQNRAPSVASTTDEKISVGGDEETGSIQNDIEEVFEESKEAKEVKTEVEEETGNKLNGLELLTEGISRMETNSEKNSTKEEDLTGSNKNNLSILIDAADTLESSPKETKNEAIKVEPPSTPTVKCNNIPSDFNRNYRSPEAEKEAKAFIASKSVKSPQCLRNSSDESDLTSPKRTMDDMEAWEIGMRMNLAEIQRKYKEKYKELYKLQKSSTTHSRRRKSSSDSGTYTSKKIKTEKIDKDWNSPVSFSDTFVKKYKPENGKSDVANLPCNWVDKKKLFLSPSHRKNNSDLTLFADKFKSGRPNPFENLLRLSRNRQSLDDDDEDDRSEEIIKDDDEVENKSTDLNLDDDVIDEREIIGDQKVIAKVFQRAAEEEVMGAVKEPENEAAGIIDNLENSFPEDRSEEGDEDVVMKSPSPPLIPANSTPLVVSPLKIKKSFMSDSEEFECQVPKKKSKKSKKYKKNKKDKEDKKLKKVKKMKVSVVRTPPTSSCLDITLEKNYPSPKKALQKRKKFSSSDEEDEDSNLDLENDLFGPKSAEDCALSAHDLRDGLRVLTKIEGHFHPSTIKAISPPDIYGVIVDKERGNKPHIFSREEVLKAAIYEVKPNSIEDVPIGTRVCAYWSQKYNHLYPGTIGEPGSPNPKLDPNYFVNVELDDGDSRDIHIDSVRYLPPDYPLVQYEPDPMAFGCRRKRMFSTDSVLSTSSISSTKTNDAKDETPHKVFRNRKDSTSSNHVTKVIIKSSDFKFKIRSSPESNESNNNKSLTNNKSSMAAFLPAQQLWCWADKGIKKGRRIIHNSIKRDDDETLSVGACAVFLSTGRPDRPYIGRLESLWETHGSNSMRNMRVKVRWFYHACETKGKSKDGEVVENLKLPGALFESYHYDENDVQTISHGCDVLPISEYFAKLSEEPCRINTIYENNDLYYLAGNYDPVEEDIKFYPKVFEDYKVK